MSDDFDKKEWQARQEAQDAMLEKQREKDAKSKARKARNAKRKLERLRAKLKETDELTDWEDEFSESVTERLDKYGSAFRDREKGGASDALSFAQKKVISSLSKKAKGETSGSSFKNKGGFKSKKPKFTPRVRQLDEDFEDETKDEDISKPAVGKFASEKPVSVKPASETSKRPFLRIVSNKDLP